ncbi:D-alanine--D-alanine ligase [Anaeroselena agilis]|uniref:D-alanine--D-alanine ligase n=1 Tax=Anaeroselena agilis TaxID=3063788 RepID=A0ABU3NZG7_9FIRM|nr:D-alanine--D-alanine ligase [Selenomonadales bacterium 4137-cl]
MKDKRIAVVMGGPSAEREVSLNTGGAILAALREKGYDTVAVDLEPKRFIEQLREAGAQVVFNAVHGKYGEDGLLQGALELLGLPYTGSGVQASANAMDKGISKRLFLQAGISTPASRLYSAVRAKTTPLAGEIIAAFGLPVVVKPASQGSSIGVTIVEAEEALAAALDTAFRYDDHVLIEKFIKGRELTVAILGTDNPQALPVIEIVPRSGRYDYTSKYTKGATEYLCPASLDETAAKAVQAEALAAFALLGCRGIGRVDVMMDADGTPYVLEVNTIPGMTATSLVPKAAAAAGISFPDLCEQILLMAQ